VIDNLNRGCSIGSNGMVCNLNYNFTARADTKVTLLRLNKEDLKALINSCDDLDREVICIRDYYDRHEIPYVDFRVFRDSRLHFDLKLIAFRAIRRLLNVNKKLKLRSATEIISLLKLLQKKYNNKIKIDDEPEHE
jgi:CRP-like cAMP-binding protein